MLYLELYVSHSDETNRLYFGKVETDSCILIIYIINKLTWSSSSTCLQLFGGLKTLALLIPGVMFANPIWLASSAERKNMSFINTLTVLQLIKYGFYGAL